MNALALRRNADWRDTPRVFARLAVSLAVLGATPALAQGPAWPTDAPQQQSSGAPAWPTDNAPPQPRPTGIAPGGGFGPPQGGPPPGGFGPGGGGPPGGGGGQTQAQQQCILEFNRLRGEVDKKGQVAKAISQRKGSREDLCAAVTGILGAETTWVKYAKTNASSCGIPPQIIKQLDGGHANLVKLKEQVCNGGGAAGGGPRAPSLSEALGTTTRLPDKDNTSVKRGGTLDTLTGNPIR